MLPVCPSVLFLSDFLLVMAILPLVNLGNGLWATRVGYESKPDCNKESCLRSLWGEVEGGGAVKASA